MDDLRQNVDSQPDAESSNREQLRQGTQATSKSAACLLLVSGCACTAGLQQVLSAIAKLPLSCTSSYLDAPSAARCVHQVLASR